MNGGNSVNDIELEMEEVDTMHNYNENLDGSVEHLSYNMQQ